ncbi:ammonium transporter family-domain-containing protein [Pisolithus microcarpus]|nr:ammonium transporter family-domain-containing protein [Pisolithus microcarpus]
MELGSGFGGLAYGWVLGRQKDKELINFRPHNVAMVNLSTFILWFGWLSFNRGCTYGANLRAVMVIWNAMLSLTFAGIVWCLLDHRLEQKYSMVRFCSGSIAGLVAATVAAGYLQLWASVIMGIISGVVCNYGTKVKLILGINNAFDIFAVHAVGGIISLLSNGIFASCLVIALDGVNVNVNGGWVNHNWKQLYVQFDYICAASGYTFMVMAIIAKAIDMICGLQLRMTPEGKSVGLDEIEIREYTNDYVEVRRHFYDLSALGEHKGDSLASDLFVSGDKNGSLNLRKSVHLLQLEDSTKSGDPPSHVLAEDIYAPEDIPSSKTTNMDGYAIHSSDPPGIYQVLTSLTHKLFSELPKGSIFHINIGQPLPTGTDSVIRVEDTELESAPKDADGEDIEEDQVKTLAQVSPGENVHQPGSDVHKGELVMQIGEVITSSGGEVEHWHS